MDNVIKIASRPSDLTGEGLEYLVVGGQVIAKFLDGNMPVAQAIDVNEVTKSAA